MEGQSHSLYPIGKHVHYLGGDYVVVANEETPFTESVAKDFHLDSHGQKFRIFPLESFDYLIAEYATDGDGSVVLKNADFTPVFHEGLS